MSVSYTHDTRKNVHHRSELTGDVELDELDELDEKLRATLSHPQQERKLHEQQWSGE